MPQAQRTSDPSDDDSSEARQDAGHDADESTDGGDEAADPVIVGIGASAGGLEAFSQLLTTLPAEIAAAFVFVQHLAPQRESALVELFSKVTKLSVAEATDGARLRAGHVYVIPPNVQLALTDGHLRMTPRPSDRTQFLPIDFLFRSLAEHAKERSIGVVLSGSAADGSAGLREIKAVGGVTMAQDPATARFDGMPLAAIRTGMVDLVLPPRDLGSEIARLVSGPADARRHGTHPGDGGVDPDLGQVFRLLRDAMGVDFSQYKLPTIRRRLRRRMMLHRIDSLERYVQFLRATPAEVGRLYQDILIQVTRFFRDPESFAALAEVVFPRITNESEQVRIWVPGCATGEEAYSIAIALLEFLGEKQRSTPIQLFATDLSQNAIEVARAGTYPESISADVSDERLRRFFTKVDGGYRIHRAVRDLIVFARQDLGRDPPFSRLDLIVCRNVLIYLGAPLQKRLMSSFHYALKPSGYLLLGSAETIGTSADLFASVDKRQKIYGKKAGVGRLDTDFVSTPQQSALSANPRHEPPAGTTDLGAKANRILLEKFAPPGVIVDGEYQILQFRGHTGVFLEPAPGEASLNVLKMVRAELLHTLRTALQEARKVQATVVKRGSIGREGVERAIDIEVVPLRSDNEVAYFLVLFQDVSAPGPEVELIPPTPAPGSSEQVARLEQELAASREYLQSVIQDLEAMNEELKSANEEILSSNEELQSTNEELDTSKEELQSTNEELSTLNDELQARNEELVRVNSDLVNLLASVQVAIVIVSSDLRIRRFTPAAERVLNLIPGDVGRPIGNIAPNIDCPDLVSLIQSAVDDVQSTERDVRDSSGNWYSLRVRPYKSIDNKIDGAVLSLFGIDTAKRYEAEITAARDLVQAAFEAVPRPLILLDGQLRVRDANTAFCDLVGETAAALRGLPIVELRHNRWTFTGLAAPLAGILASGRPIEGFVLDLVARPSAAAPHEGRATVQVRRIAGDGHDPFLLLLVLQLGS